MDIASKEASTKPKNDDTIEFMAALFISFTKLVTKFVKDVILGR